MQYSTVVLESQPDWLTVMYEGQPETVKAGLDAAHAWTTQEEGRGCTLNRFTSHGFTGMSCGRVRWGLSDAACLVSCSGDKAREVWDEAAALGGRATRVDVAVTARLDPPTDHYSEQAFYQMQQEGGKNWDARSVKLFQDNRRGSTLYINARSSDWYLRCYNKAAEDPTSERYRNSWRWEVEAKHAAALRLVSILSSPDTRSAAAARVVFDQFSRRGCIPPWIPTANIVYPRGFGRRSDRERRLEYFRTTINPMLGWFFVQDDGAAALDALGLTIEDVQRILRTGANASGPTDTTGGPASTVGSYRSSQNL